MNYVPVEGANQDKDSTVQEARFSADYMLIFGNFVFYGKETANLLVIRQDVRLRMGMTWREILKDGSHSTLEASGGNTRKVITESQLATCPGSSWKHGECSWGHCGLSRTQPTKLQLGP